MAVALAYNSTKNGLTLVVTPEHHPLAGRRQVLEELVQHLPADPQVLARPQPCPVHASLVAVAAAAVVAAAAAALADDVGAANLAVVDVVVVVGEARTCADLHM